MQSRAAADSLNGDDGHKSVSPPAVHSLRRGRSEESEDQPLLLALEDASGAPPPPTPAEPIPGYHHSSRFLVWSLACLAMPLDFAWAAGEALVVPRLIGMGVSVSTCSWMWILPPVLFFFSQGSITRASDRSRRRRPYIAWFAAFAALGLSSIAVWSTSAPIVFAGFCAVDFCHDVLSTFTRAYVNEATPPRLLQEVNGAYSFMSGLGRLLGMAVASLPVGHFLAPIGLSDQFTAMFALSSVAHVVLTYGVLLIGPPDKASVIEEDEGEEEDDDGGGGGGDDDDEGDEASDANGDGGRSAEGEPAGGRVGGTDRSRGMRRRQALGGGEGDESTGDEEEGNASGRTLVGARTGIIASDRRPVVQPVGRAGRAHGVRGHIAVSPDSEAASGKGNGAHADSADARRPRARVGAATGRHRGRGTGLAALAPPVSSEGASVAGDDEALVLVGEGAPGGEDRTELRRSASHSYVPSKQASQMRSGAAAVRSQRREHHVPPHAHPAYQADSSRHAGTRGTHGRDMHAPHSAGTNGDSDSEIGDPSCVGVLVRGTSDPTHWSGKTGDTGSVATTSPPTTLTVALQGETAEARLAQAQHSPTPSSSSWVHQHSPTQDLLDGVGGQSHEHTRKGQHGMTHTEERVTTTLRSAYLTVNHPTAPAAVANSSSSSGTLSPTALAVSALQVQVDAAARDHVRASHATLASSATPAAAGVRASLTDYGVSRLAGEDTTGGTARANATPVATNTTSSAASPPASPVHAFVRGGGRSTRSGGQATVAGGDEEDGGVAGTAARISDWSGHRGNENGKPVRVPAVRVRKEADASASIVPHTTAAAPTPTARPLPTGARRRVRARPPSPSSSSSSLSSRTSTEVAPAEEDAGLLAVWTLMSQATREVQLLVLGTFTGWLLLMLQALYWPAWASYCTLLLPGMDPVLAGGLTPGQQDEAQQVTTTVLSAGTTLSLVVALALTRANRALGTASVFWWSLLMLSAVSMMLAFPAAHTLTGSIILVLSAGACESVLYDNPFVLVEHAVPERQRAQYVGLLTTAMSMAQLVVAVIGWASDLSICRITDLFVAVGFGTAMIQLAGLAAVVHAAATDEL